MSIIHHVTSSKTTRQFKRYFFVAGLGYLVDFGTLYILHSFLNVYYLIAAAIGFILGLVVVYIMSDLFVFSDSKIKSKSFEIGVFVLIGVIGLGILSLIMWGLTGLLGVNYLLSKILATIIVYLWNFFARQAMYHN